MKKSKPFGQTPPPTVRPQYLKLVDLTLSDAPLPLAIASACLPWRIEDMPVLRTRTRPALRIVR